jgi:hypothetical protein
MNGSVKRTVSLIIVFIFALMNSVAFAQNKHDLVRQVRFERGKSDTTIAEVLMFGAKHVYRLKARKGQTMSIQLESNDKDLEDIVFTVQSRHYLPGSDTRILDGFDPSGDTLGWSRELPFTAEYEIVVHNPPISTKIDGRQIGYKLKVTIK